MNANDANASGAPDGRPGVEPVPRLSGYRLLGLALLVVLLVQAVFVSSYVGALPDPKPRDVQVGIVGPAPLAAAVARQVGFELVPYASEAAARDAIDHRRIEGAFIGAPGGATLLVVPAARPAMASGLANAFGVGAAAVQQKLAVVQVHPLPPGDAGGATSFLVVMALVVGGYLAATISLVFGGAATRHRRLLALAIVSVVGSFVTDLIAGPVIGALPSSKFLVLWALFLLVMTAVAFSTAALQTLFGPAGTLIVVVLFVIFGAPAAGGTVPSAFLPGVLARDRPLPAGRSGPEGGRQHGLFRRQRDRLGAHRPSRLPRRGGADRRSRFANTSTPPRPWRQTPRPQPPSAAWSCNAASRPDRCSRIPTIVHEKALAVGARAWIDGLPRPRQCDCGGLGNRCRRAVSPFDRGLRGRGDLRRRYARRREADRPTRS